MQPGPDDPKSGDALAPAVFGALLREHEKLKGTASDHPGLDMLVAYRSGGLTGAAAATLQAHLGGCAECVALLLDLDSFVEPGTAAGPGAADIEQAAAWRRLRPAIEAQLVQDDPDRANTEEAGSAPGAARSPPRIAPPWLGVVGLAATLAFAVTTGGLLVHTFRLDSRLAFLNQPSADAPVYYVETGVKRGEGAVQRFEPPAAAHSFLFMIESPELPASGCCTIEIVGEAGERLWSGRLRPASSALCAYRCRGRSCRRASIASSSVVRKRRARRAQPRASL